MHRVILRQIEKLEKDLRSCRLQLQESAQQYDDEHGAMEAELRALRTEYHNVVNELATRTVLYEAQERQWRERILASGQHQSHQTAELSEAYGKMHHLEQQLERCERERVEALFSSRESTLELQRAAAERAEAVDAAQRLELELSAATATIADLRASVSQLRSTDLEQLERHMVQEMEAIRLSARTESDALRRQLGEATSWAEDEQRRSEALSAQLEDLRAEWRRQVEMLRAIKVGGDAWEGDAVVLTMASQSGAVAVAGPIKRGRYAMENDPQENDIESEQRPELYQDYRLNFCLQFLRSLLGLMLSPTRGGGQSLSGEIAAALSALDGITLESERSSAGAAELDIVRLKSELADLVLHAESEARPSPPGARHVPLQSPSDAAIDEVGSFGFDEDFLLGAAPAQDTGAMESCMHHVKLFKTRFSTNFCEFSRSAEGDGEQVETGGARSTETTFTAGPSGTHIRSLSG